MDDREGRLRRHLELGEHVARFIADLRERQVVPIDELLELVVAAAPCNADELGLTGPPLCCFLDRGSFPIAGASPRRPEPQQHGTAGEGAEFDVAATDQRRGELQGSRNLRHGRRRLAGIDRWRSGRSRRWCVCRRGCIRLTAAAPDQQGHGNNGERSSEHVGNRSGGGALVAAGSSVFRERFRP